MVKKKQKKISRKEKKKGIKDQIRELDINVVEYIKKLKFRRKLLGCDREDLFVAVSNIQKYYDEKMRLKQMEFDKEIIAMNEEINKKEADIEFLKAHIVNLDKQNLEETENWPESSENTPDVWGDQHG